jgi:hypothetical protein
MALIKVRANERVDERIREVGPTLMVGLGGTGKDVLLRLRRLLVEHYGELETLPFIRFLHIDTDQTQEAREQYDLKALDDPLYERIAFKRNELVDLHIPGGTSQVIDNIDKYEHIRGWFQVRGRMSNLGDLGKGAGQIRMASRLALHLKASEIMDYIQRVAGELLQAKVHDQAQKMGFNINPANKDIYVIGSLGGGTGSGIFIDMGFLLKQTMNQFYRSGIFLLPAVFSGMPAENRIKANGYAALMELNHYSFGNQFSCQWSQSEKRLLAPPPYDTTYLIDRENAAGLEALPNELYQMIAESLFQDFSLGNFADKKRSVRVNLVQFTQNAYIDYFWEGFEGADGATQRNMLGDAFTLRFSSFGLSAILLPVERIQSACACRLAWEIIDLWQQQSSEGLLEDLYTRFLAKENIYFAQGDINLRDGSRLTEQQLEKELIWQNKGAGISYEQYCKKRVDQLRGELKAAPMKTKYEPLEVFMGDVEVWFGKEDSDRDDEWGQVARNIAANADEYLKHLKKAIREECERLANNPRYGIAYVVALLSELKKTIESELENIWYTDYFNRQMQSWTEWTVYYKGQLDVVADELRQHERSFLFRGDNVNRDILLLCGEPDAMEKGLLENWLHARLHRLKARWGKYVCEAINEFLGKDGVHGSGLIAEHRKLIQFLDEFKARLKSMRDYFERPQSYSLYKSLLEPGDFDYWYKVWVGGDADRPNYIPRLTEFSNSLLRTVFESESITAALSMIKVSTAESIERRILTHCKSLLKKQTEQPSVLRALFQSGMDERVREQKVSQAFNQAKAQLHPPTDLGHVVYERPTANQCPYYIGLDGTDPFAGQFEAILRKVVPPGDRWEIVSLGADNKGAIVFFNELSGVPAFYPRSVNVANGLRQWYRTYFTDPMKMDPNNQEVLHTHKNRFLFSDIIPKTRDQQERYKYAVRSFVLGRILDLLRTTDQRDGTLFSYEDDSNPYMAPKIIGLGLGENEAIDFLFQRDQSEQEKAVYVMLDRKIEQTVDSLHSSGFLIIYILLLEFYQKTVYAPEDVNDLDDVRLRKYTPQYAAIAHELSRMVKRCRDTGMESALGEARWKMTGGRKELTVEEYTEVLKPYCRVEGAYTQRSENAVGGMQLVSKKALVFNRQAFLQWLSKQPGHQPVQSGLQHQMKASPGGEGRQGVGSPQPDQTQSGWGAPQGQQQSGPSQGSGGGFQQGQSFGTPPGEQGQSGWGAPQGQQQSGPSQGSGGGFQQGQSFGTPPGEQGQNGWGAPSSPTQIEETGEYIRCPRCNHVVPKSSTCANCGTVLHV